MLCTRSTPTDLHINTYISSTRSLPYWTFLPPPLPPPPPKRKILTVPFYSNPIRSPSPPPSNTIAEEMKKHSKEPESLVSFARFVHLLSLLAHCPHDPRSWPRALACMHTSARQRPPEANVASLSHASPHSPGLVVNTLGTRDRTSSHECNHTVSDELVGGGVSAISPASMLSISVHGS